MTSLEESIRFQQGLVADMKEHGVDGYACTDRRTGERLSRGEMYDRHAQLCWVIIELESKFEARK